MKERGMEIRLMEGVNFGMQMGMYMRESGRMTRLTDMEYTFI